MREISIGVSLSATPEYNFVPKRRCDVCLARRDWSSRLRLSQTSRSHLKDFLIWTRVVSDEKLKDIFAWVSHSVFVHDYRRFCKAHRFPYYPHMHLDISIAQIVQVVTIFILYFKKNLWLYCRWLCQIWTGWMNNSMRWKKNIWSHTSFQWSTKGHCPNSFISLLQHSATETLHARCYSTTKLKFESSKGSHPFSFL